MCLTIFTEACCCAGKLTCEGCCLICKSLCDTSHKQQIKIAYILMLIFSILFIIYITDIGVTYLYSWRDLIHCNIESGGDLNCLGISAIYRTSFCLFLLHVIILLFCLMRNSFSKMMNEGFWPIKFTFVIVMLYFSFYIPNPFFQMYSELAKIIGISFILFQIIMMIDLFYLWGEKWINYYSNNGQYWGYFLIATTVLLYTCSFMINIFSFGWFTDKSSLNSFLIILNIILIIIFSLISISGIARNGSLLTSAGISLYETFLFWSGLRNTSKESNHFYRSHTPLNLEIFIGIITITLSLFYVTFHKTYLGESSDFQTQTDSDREEQVGVVVDPDMINEQLKSLNAMKLDIYRDTNVFINFHIIMIISTFFISMLFTNWGAPNLNQQIVYSYEPNEFSYWTQIISSWTVIGIYLWTLVAPKILTNRDFD